MLRPALDALALRMDGRPAAASTVSRKRAIFYNALEYAVELGHLPSNPIPAIKWRAPKLTEAVNPRVVINHGQARALLDAVRQQPSGRRWWRSSGSCTTRRCARARRWTCARRP